MDETRRVQAEFVSVEETLRAARVQRAQQIRRSTAAAAVGLTLVIAAIIGFSTRRQLERLSRSFAAARDEAVQQAALLDLAHDAISVRDMEGRILFWNQGAEATYGWSREQAVGRVTHDLLRTRFPAPLEEVERCVREREGWEGELTQSSAG